MSSNPPLYQIIIWHHFNNGSRILHEYFFSESEVKTAIDLVKEDASIKEASLYCPSGKGFGITLKGRKNPPIPPSLKAIADKNGN